MIERKWNLQAQACSNRLKQQFQERINVVSARVINTPAYFKHINGVAKLIQTASVRYNAKCFLSTDFICHTMGVRGGVGRDRRFIFEHHLHVCVASYLNSKRNPLVKQINQASFGRLNDTWGIASQYISF